MALFNKDNDKDEIIRQSEEPLEEAADENRHVLNDGRRFYFVVEGVFPVRAGTVVRGVIHGRIDVDDDIYILQPHNPALRTKVKGMEAQIESYMMKIQTATDMIVHLFLAIDPARIEQFAVITSVKPMLPADEDMVVENPALSAMLYEKRLLANEKFLDLYCFILVHSRYITAAQMKGNAVDGGDEPVPFDRKAAPAFCMLKDSKNPQKHLIPVFTDEVELRKCEHLLENEDVRLVTMSFANIVEVINAVGCDGFVVNPCSGNQSVIQKEFIWGITESEGYKNEFQA